MRVQAYAYFFVPVEIIEGTGAFDEKSPPHSKSAAQGFERKHTRLPPPQRSSVLNPGQAVRYALTSGSDCLRQLVCGRICNGW